ncbi:S-layer homology domain-containing protein [Paenibacillus pasadenensis]|uniref:S-layer homology domain-containing protein n=1 Tax=Paenibacillus pasadenensis TaxID=217090 RepID=UPI00203F8C5D|nr:S-layer homology domain-containing protein [Paenibacillus pasadenensis]MCM3749773.1 S-layer homology domain-containing protein [Paenibacillus pasadenensis]
MKLKQVARPQMIWLIVTLTLVFMPFGTSYAQPFAAGDSVLSSLEIYTDSQPHQQMAVLETSELNGRPAVIAVLDNGRVQELVEAGAFDTLLIPVKGDNSDVVGARLNGQLIKAMQDKKVKIELRTDRGSFRIPTVQIQMDQLINRLGSGLKQSDVAINISIADVPFFTLDGVVSQARVTNSSVMGGLLGFEVTASYGGSSVSIDRFQDYVVRSIAIPEEIEPSQIATGIVIGPDKRFRHVPTAVIEQDGAYYASIKSLTNGVFALIEKQPSFLDINHHWAEKNIKEMAARLILNGSSSNKFEPDLPVTRAEFAAILLRSLGIHDSNTSEAASFKDVPAASWYGHTVETAASYNLISGYSDGSFKPHGSITRAEAMVIMERAMQLVHLGQPIPEKAAELRLDSFKDESELGGWARSAAAAVLNQGLVQGSEGKLLPNEPLTRAEAASILRRLLQQFIQL